MFSFLIVHIFFDSSTKRYPHLFLFQGYFTLNFLSCYRVIRMMKVYVVKSNRMIKDTSTTKWLTPDYLFFFSFRSISITNEVLTNNNKKKHFINESYWLTQIFLYLAFCFYRNLDVHALLYRKRQMCLLTFRCFLCNL